MNEEQPKNKCAIRSWIQTGLIILVILLATIIILSNNNSILSNNNSCSIHDYKGYFEGGEKLLNNVSRNVLELHHTLVNPEYPDPTPAKLGELEMLIRERCQ